MSQIQKPLTNRQTEILQFIQDQSVPPTVREIGAAFGIRSPNAVRGHIKALESKGYLRREGHCSRNLRTIGTLRKISLKTMMVEIDEQHERVTVTCKATTSEQKEFTFTGTGVLFADSGHSA